MKLLTIIAAFALILTACGTSEEFPARTHYQCKWGSYQYQCKRFDSDAQGHWMNPRKH